MDLKTRIAIFAYLKNLKAPAQTHFLKHYRRKEADLAALKAEMESLDRRIQLSLKPISEEAETAPKDEKTELEQQDTAMKEHAAINIPSRLQQIAAASDGHIVISSIPKPGNKSPGKKLKW